MIKVTPEMIKAGELISNSLITANICKFMNGLGGGATWDEWNKKVSENKDLCMAYVEGKITSVEAIYTAMERTRII